jgi:hypothetical protein
MPQEVSDIKQFIEICRRKDASCKFGPAFYAVRLMATTKRNASIDGTTADMPNSGAHQEGQEA